MERKPKREQPFYIHVRKGDVLTVNNIPLRVSFIEGRGEYSLIGLAIDPPAAGEIDYDKARKILTMGGVV